MKFVVLLLITLVIVSAYSSDSKNRGHAYNNNNATGDDSGDNSDGYSGDNAYGGGDNAYGGGDNAYGGGDNSDGDSEDKPDGDNGDKPGGDNGDKPDGDNGDKPDGDNGDKPDGDSEDKPDGDSGDKPDGDSGDKPDGDSGDNLDGDNLFLQNQTDFPVVKPRENDPDPEQLIDIQTQVTELDRLGLLSNEDYVFDFLHPFSGISNGEGGNTVAATAKNFPALIGHDIAMTVGFIEPCGINLPHIHPRATEINFIVSGEFQGGFFSENGGKFIGHTLKPGMATVFPKGVIHFEVNMQCERAVFVAAFNNQDPGVTTIASAFFGLPTEIVGGSLGNLDVGTVEELMQKLPMNPGSIDECRKRCGL